jgi:hypothetical protein
MKVLPSQVVQAIESVFGTPAMEMYNRLPGHYHIVEVNTILSLLDDMPAALIDLPFNDYVVFMKCRSTLAVAAARWRLGDIAPAKAVDGKDAVELLRRLLRRCQDETPPPEPELPFISDLERRAGIQAQMHASWVDFAASEWLGSTTFAGASLEALLLWALESLSSDRQGKNSKPPNELSLQQMIDEALARGLIKADTATKSHFARDARNLIHPGRVSRLGGSCSKASALTALAALYNVIEDLSAAAVAGR